MDTAILNDAIPAIGGSHGYAWETWVNRDGESTELRHGHTLRAVFFGPRSRLDAQIALLALATLDDDAPAA